VTKAAEPFSVVMPLYNKRPFLRRSVESVLAQSFPQFELIVVDDGSTDGSAALLDETPDPRIRLVRQPNAGVAVARNRGIAEAKHGWIALLDADDIWGPDHLAELHAMLVRYPEAGLAATRIVLGWDRLPAWDGEKGDYRVRKVDYFAEAARNSRIVTSSSAALKREAVAAIGGFRNYRIGEDLDCWARLALDWPVIVSDRLTACYVRGTGGAIDSSFVAPPIGRRSRKAEPSIVTIEEISTPIGPLLAALRSGRYEEKRHSIELFIDERVIASARRRLLVGDAVGARCRLAFVHHKRRRDYFACRAISLIPAAISRILIDGFRLAKQHLALRPFRRP
jgi:hypothetical protein